MKNIRFFYLKIFLFRVVKISIYLNRRAFVMVNTWYLPYSCPSKIFKTRNRMVGYVTCTCNDLPPLRRHWHRSCKRSRLNYTTDYFLISHSKQLPKIYNFAHICSRIAWNIHFDQFLHESRQKLFRNWQTFWNYSIQSTLVISKYKGLWNISRYPYLDIYQICRIEGKINRISPHFHNILLPIVRFPC